MAKNSVRISELIDMAKGLLEPGEEHLNREYTRALIELCCEAEGLAQDDKPLMARKFGIPADRIHLVI